MTAADTGARAALLARLVDDLDEGFADLVRAYDGAVYSVALQVCGQQHTAEDLAAEAFLRAYRALRGYPPERIMALQPRAWLLTILLNRWRNAVRDSSRRPAEGPLDATELPHHAPSVEEHAERRERSRELARLVAELPTAQRVAVVLRHVVGLSVTEIGAVMDCPEGTVKSHVSRGLKRLRAAYDAGVIGGAAVVTPLRPRPRPAGTPVSGRAQ